MSYILDALKKADAQRERDPARGIHAQPAALPTLQQPGLGQRPWFWTAAAAAIAALAAAGWLLLQERADVRRAPVSESAAGLPGVPVPRPAPLGTTVPPPDAVADAVLPPPTPVAPPVVAAAPGKGAAPSGETAARAARSATMPEPAPALPAPLAAAPVAPAAPGEPAIVNGLPADAPRLAISGGVYSANRTQRMLIVNGQVVNEGADLGGGVELEEIRPKAAVLRFRGGRYNVGF